MQTILTRSGRIAAAAAGAALAAFLLAGCHDDNPPADNTTVTPPASSSTTVVTPPAGTTTTPGTTTTTTTPDTKINTNAGPGGSTGTDSALSDAVNTAIVHNKQMTGSRVEPVATAGVVTLNGQVQNQQQKALAEKTASQVPGVSSVKNKLIIVTTGGAKPKPIVVTKTKTVIVHDKAAPADNGASGTQTPAAPANPATPAAPDNTMGAGNTGAGTNTGTSNP